MNVITHEEENIQAEMELIYLEEYSGFGRLSRFVVRLFIRTLRVAFGAVLLGLSFWAGSKAWEILAVPFAAQSIVGIVGGLGLGAVFLWLLQASFACAFGPGPSREEEERRVRARAIERLGSRIHLSNAHRNLPRDETASYAVGRWLGRLLRRS